MITIYYNQFFYFMIKNKMKLKLYQNNKIILYSTNYIFILSFLFHYRKIFRFKKVNKLYESTIIISFDGQSKCNLITSLFELDNKIILFTW